MVVGVQVTQLYPAEELAKCDVAVAVRVAEVEVPCHLVLGVLSALSDKMTLVEDVSRVCYCFCFVLLLLVVTIALGDKRRPTNQTRKRVYTAPGRAECSQVRICDGSDRTGAETRKDTTTVKKTNYLSRDEREIWYMREEQLCTTTVALVDYKNNNNGANQAKAIAH